MLNEIRSIDTYRSEPLWLTPQYPDIPSTHILPPSVEQRSTLSHPSLQSSKSFLTLFTGMKPLESLLFSIIFQYDIISLGENLDRIDTLLPKVAYCWSQDRNTWLESFYENPLHTHTLNEIREVGVRRQSQNTFCKTVYGMQNRYT